SLNCQSIYEPGIVKFKNNPAFTHFFKSRAVPLRSSPKAASILGLDDDNDDDDDDVDDFDYHHPLLEDVQTITFRKKIDRAPSTGGSTSSDWSELSMDSVGNFTPQTTPTSEERGEFLRQAAEALDPSIYTPEVYKTIRESQELGYDCTMTPKKNYHLSYTREQKARSTKLFERLQKFESLHSRDIPNPFL
ncbi:hypothetical protein BGX31_005509, partial [Mortierella sp. GBA43]